MEMECVFMRICPNCGHQLEDDSVFCGNCGTALPAPAPAAASGAAGQNMAFCPNCGEKLPEDSAFCPNCGTAVRSAPAPAPAVQKPAKMKGGKSKIIIGVAVAAAVAVVLGVAAYAVTGLFSSPAKKFISYQEDLFMTEVLSQLEKGVDKVGSTSFSSDLTITASVDNSNIDYYLSDSAINLGIDYKKNNLIASGELVLMGSSVIDGTFTYEDGKIGFQLPQVDNSYYVMDIGALAEEISGRNVHSNDLKMPEISGKQWRTLVENYLKVVYPTVTKKNLKVEKKKTVRLSGLSDSFTGTVYTFTPTAEDIEDLMNRLADQIEKDKELRKLLVQLIGSEEMIELMGGYISPGSDIEDEIDDFLLEAAEELERNARSIGREVERADFSWTLAVEGSNVRQIKISVGRNNSIVYEAKGTESDKRTEMLYVMDNGSKEELLERSYTKKGSKYDGSLTVTDAFTLDYDMDTGKTSVFGIPYGEYRLYLPGENASTSLKVADGAKKGSVDHILTFKMDRNSYYSYSYPAFNQLSVTVNATNRSSVKKPSGREVDISDYSDWELEQLIDDIGETLGREFINNLPLGSLLYGGYGGYGW